MQTQTLPTIEIQKSSLSEFAEEPVKSTKLFHLIYVADASNGIKRTKSGKNFRYFFNEKSITDEKVLTRIKNLVIPPAWNNVWICSEENGHLQATGTDAMHRKQYRYHVLWNKMRSETKYFRLYDFGKNLPALRQQLEKDIAEQGLHLKKILATIVMLMEQTSIRIGNSVYEKLYGSYGLTTFKNRHVNIKGNNLLFTFKGKKGVDHEISLHSKKLALIVRKCLDVPGKELFQFYDDAGERHSIHSGMVNEYIQKISGKEFSAKDFRTWSGSISAITICNIQGSCEEQNAKQKINEILDEVAKHLGNTRNVCRKYYVYPSILELYQTNKLNKYLPELNKPIKTKDKSGYTPVENVLMKILKSNYKTAGTIKV